MTIIRYTGFVVLASIAVAIGVVSAAQDVPREAQAQAKSLATKTEAEAEAAIVPFEMLPSNHMVVEAKLNGEGPFRLIFDLGSPVILLSNRAAEASKAIPNNAPKSFLFGVRGEGKIKDLEVGELQADDLPVVVMDHPALKALGGMLGKPLDGIIGYTFFARYRTTIDYKTKQMTFTPVDAPVRDLMKDLPQRMMGPKVAKRRMLAPSGLWGLEVADHDQGLSGLGVPVKAVLAESPAAAGGLKARRPPGEHRRPLDHLTVRCLRGRRRQWLRHPGARRRAARWPGTDPQRHATRRTMSRAEAQGGGPGPDPAGSAGQ